MCKEGKKNNEKLQEALTIAIEALDFYSHPDRYKAKTKKMKPRIIRDSGVIANRTMNKIEELLQWIKVTQEKL